MKNINKLNLIINLHINRSFTVHFIHFINFVKNYLVVIFHFFIFSLVLFFPELNLRSKNVSAFIQIINNRFIAEAEAEP